MKINIKPFHFTELLNKGYSLDGMYILELIQNGKELTPLIEENKKIIDLILTLRRKQLILEDKHELTTKGKELLLFLDTKTKALKLKKPDNNDEFSKWWAVFPPSDIFTYKGQSFSGARSIRVNKDACRMKFEKILLEGEYTAEQLIHALEYHVEQIKETSVKQRQNKLTYLQNSLTYLNQRVYEPFIELVKNEVEIEKAFQISNGTDI